MQAFVPKNRRLKFELRLKILDLNNVPLVSGTSYVKWHLPNSNSAEHRGRTPKSGIKEHKVAWDYEKTLPVRLFVDKTGMLQETEINFEILQEYASGGRGERIVLGQVKLNLAEYVEGSDGDGEEGITRRYLMQESKINSTLKISIYMKQLEGEKNFIAPPLKTAAVFGGIAGIMSAEQTEPDEPGHLSTMNSKSRENGQAQDAYRRTLTASWQSQEGQLTADQCIENLFAGGDGWAPGSSLTTTTTYFKPRLHHHPKPAAAHHYRLGSTSSSLSSSGVARRRESQPAGGGEDDSTSLSDTEQHAAHPVVVRRSAASPPSSSTPFPRTPIPAGNTHLHDALSRASGAHLRPGAPGHTRNSSTGKALGRKAHGGSGGAGTGSGSDSTGHNGSRRGGGVGQERVVEVDELDLRENLRSWRLPISG